MKTFKELQNNLTEAKSMTAVDKKGKMNCMVKDKKFNIKVRLMWLIRLHKSKLYS